MSMAARTNAPAAAQPPQPERWIRPYFGMYRKQLLAALGLGVLAFACATLLMFTAGYLISATGERPERGIFAVMIPIAFVQIFGLGKPLARYVERLVSHDWVFRMTSRLRLRLYGIVERAAKTLGDTRTTGDYLGYVAEDIGHVQNLYLRTIFPCVVAMLIYALAVAASGAFDWMFALFMALVFGITGIVMPLVGALANRARIEAVKAAKARMYRDLTDNVMGAADWMFSGRGREYLDRRAAADELERQVDRQVRRYIRRTNLVASALFCAGAVATLAWAGWYFGGQASGTSPWIAAFALGFFPLMDVFAPLPEAAIQANTHRESVQRLNDLPPDGDPGAAQPERLSKGTVPFDNPGETTAMGASSLAAQALPIAVDEVRFAYPDASEEVLAGVTLRIAAGQKVALLGRSGSGKSTLMMLMHGDAAPTGGSVRVGAQEASGLERPEQAMGLIGQRTYLFNRTLRENLRIGNPQADDEYIIEALHRVGLSELLAQLPRGLDTMVDEAGTRFSGGERHRIALARVLLADVPVVLLDEPTVGLDPLTEQGILDTLFDVFADRTLVMVTHHLQGIERFDRVVFIEDGAVELDGSPAELARSSARFASLLAFDRGLDLPGE